MQETLATMMTSSRLTRAAVAARRRRSMFSLMSGVFFDVDVALRDVGFGLVVVVVADEIMDGVAREEGAELLVELGGQRLVVGQHQRRFAELGDHITRRKCLAGARRSEQGLARPAVAEALDELGDGLGLIAGGLEFAGQLELGGHVRPGSRIGERLCSKGYSSL